VDDDDDDDDENSTKTNYTKPEMLLIKRDFGKKTIYKT